MIQDRLAPRQNFRAIASLTKSIEGDSGSSKLAQANSSANLDLHLQRWALSKKLNNSLLFLSGFAPTAEVVGWELHSFRMSSHNTINCKHGQCDRLVRLLSIEDQVNLAVEQDSSLTQDRLASRKNFRATASLTKSIEEDSGSTILAQANSSALQFSGILLCPVIQKESRNSRGIS